MIQLLFAIAMIAYKIIKWTLIKTRLYAVAIPMAAVLIFFSDWYEANTFLADCIGITLIAGVVISWIFTLIKYIKGRKKNKELIVDWAYERYGKPVVYKKRTQLSN